MGPSREPEYDRSVDLTDPLHRTTVFILLGTVAVEAAGALVLLLVRMTQVWLMPVTAAITVGCVWLMIRVSRSRW